MNQIKQQAAPGASPSALRWRLPILMGILGMILAVSVSSCGGPGAADEVALDGGTLIHHIQTGNPAPNPGDFVYFHAYIRNGDSLLFSTRQQGQESVFQIAKEQPPGAKPHPVEQALSMMGAGDSATVSMNIDTLPQKPPGFENASVMLYDIAVSQVMTEEAYKTKQKEERAVALDTVLQSLIDEYQPGASKELQETGSGLEYLILEEGTGPQPQPGQQVKVHYRGVLLDGNTFDSSLSRGEPIDFAVGRGEVIPGWDEGIGLLKQGSKALLVVPPDLAYGQRGAPPVIPPNSNLVFYVELVGVGE